MAIHSGILVLPGSSVGQESAYSAGEEGYIPGSGSMLEKEMAAHSSTLSWRLPWTKEPVGLQTMGSQRVGHDCVTNFSSIARIITWTEESGRLHVPWT